MAKKERTSLKMFVIRDKSNGQYLHWFSPVGVPYWAEREAFFFYSKREAEKAISHMTKMTSAFASDFEIVRLKIKHIEEPRTALYAYL